MSDFSTYEIVLNRMLDNTNSKVDKREGRVLFDAVAPSAMELYNFEVLRKAAVNETFADTATRKYLIKRCAEHAITPKEATYAFVKGVFKPENLEVPIGSRYSCGEFNYAVTKKIKDGVYELRCETIGSSPNNQFGRLLPIDYINGLTSAQLTDISTYGEDEESTESLRNRYLDAAKSDSFSGNKADYRKKFLSQSGVGALKLYTGAEWNGGGTVKVVVIDSNKCVPSDDQIDQLQTWIDPVTNAGEGEGEAPVGHFVTVVAAYNTAINIDANITYAIGYTWNRVKDNIFSAIDKYIDELNDSWENTDNLIVRIAQIENHIMDVNGVIDIQNTKINGKMENLTVDKDSIVSRGTINGD